MATLPTIEDFPKSTKSAIAEGYGAIEFLDGPQQGSRRHYFELQETQLTYWFLESGRRDEYILMPPAVDATRGPASRWHWAYDRDNSFAPGGAPVTDDDIEAQRLSRTPSGRKKLLKQRLELKAA